MSHQRKCEACGGLFEYAYSQALVAAHMEFRCVPCRSKPENDVQLPPPRDLFAMDTRHSPGMFLKKSKVADFADRRHYPNKNFDSLRNDRRRGRRT